MTDQDDPATLAAPESERALLGVCLDVPEAVPTLLEHLDGDEFSDIRHEQIWRTYRACVDDGDTAPRFEPLTDRLRREHPDLLNYVPTLIGLGAYAQRDTYIATILDYSARRHLLNLFATAAHNTRNGIGPDITAALAMDGLEDYVRGIGGRVTTRRLTVPDIDTLLAQATDDDYQWLIPDLLERGDRLIITGREGHGKSTFLRQLAVQAAAGINPFRGGIITPLTVLFIDCENSERQTRRKFRGLVNAAHQLAGDRWNPNRLRVANMIAGLDLTTDTDLLTVTRMCDLTRPDLIVIGPLYKLANGDPTEERSAKPVAAALDTIRDRFDCALVIEAHSAKAPAGSKHRPIEPYGWSGWLRWPEFGICLATDDPSNNPELFELRHWRGVRDERDWPATMRRYGTEWPWQVTADLITDRWHSIRQVRVRAGRNMSQREVADATGIPKTQVARIIGSGARYAYDWALLNAGPEDTEN